MIEMISQNVYPILMGSPRHYAEIKGSEAYPNLGGMVLFYRAMKGTIVVADIAGLPQGTGKCDKKVFGFHIHEGTSCGSADGVPFSDTKNHYNPAGCLHPNHAGDMPVLFENRGKAWLAFYTERFTPEEVKGHTVVIHDMPDDYKTQPSGDSGMKIACGIIR